MIKLPNDVSYILSTFRLHGRKAFVVGGSIRDILMGKTPHDYDITTDALPQQTREIFAGEHIIDTGLKHGTVTLRINHCSYEVTTFRKEGNYSDHRHPDSVSFSGSIGDDLSRRDFTINAMAYSPYEGLIDLFDSRKDLQEGIIRTVGDPDERFEEDALRILRALRFSSRFGFVIEEKTADAIHQKKELLRAISSERIFAELSEIVTSANATKTLRQYIDVINVFLPEIREITDLDSHAGVLSLRLALLFDQLESAQIRTLMNTLHCEKKLINEVILLHEFSRKPIIDADIYMKKCILPYLTKQQFELLCDMNGITDQNLISHIIDIYDHGIYLPKQLDIDGDDLLTIGFSGRQVGQLLDELINLVRENRLANQREILMGYCKKSRNLI